MAPQSPLPFLMGNRLLLDPCRFPFLRGLLSVREFFVDEDEGARDRRSRGPHEGVRELGPGGSDLFHAARELLKEPHGQTRSPCLPMSLSSLLAQSLHDRGERLREPPAVRFRHAEGDPKEFASMLPRQIRAGAGVNEMIEQEAFFDGLRIHLGLG